jgi:hypothetical protein
MTLTAHCQREGAKASLDAIYAMGAHFQAGDERTQVDILAQRRTLAQCRRLCACRPQCAISSAILRRFPEHFLGQRIGFGLAAFLPRLRDEFLPLIHQMRAGTAPQRVRAMVLKVRQRIK